MIVSYKDRAEDRRRGLDAGADYYLVKKQVSMTMRYSRRLNLIGEARMRIGIVNDSLMGLNRCAGSSAL